MNKPTPIDVEISLDPKRYIVSETDEKGKITFCNDYFIEVSGYSKEELIGKAHSIVRHPDMPCEVFADLWQTLLSDKTWVGEIKNLKKDGGYYWVLAHVSPLYNNNGKMIGYQSIRQDITDKKVVEENTKQLEIEKKKIREKQRK